MKIINIRALVFILFFPLISTLYADSSGAFRIPKIGGVHLHWCLSLSENCGRPVADKFCSSKGFGKATAFKRFIKVGHTKILGSGKTCSGSKCDGFQFIKCVSKNANYANPYPVSNGKTTRQPPVQPTPIQPIPNQPVQNRPAQVRIAPLAKRRFKRPELNGTPLDWCLNGKSNCGMFAADKYCTKKGYKHAVSYRMRDNVSRTISLMLGQNCNNSNCKSFSYIICQR